MIYPNTVIAHTVVVFLCLASLVYLQYRVKRKEFRTFRPYYNWFLFFLLYNISLAMPLFIFNSLNLASGVFYSLGLLFLAIAMWQAFEVGLNLVVKNEFWHTLLSVLYLIGVSVAVTLHFIFPEVPQGGSDGRWVLWYSNQSISLFYVLFAFIAGWTFVAGCIKGFLIHRSRFLRFRILLFLTAGFILPLSALYYFGAETYTHIYVAQFLAILSMALFAIVHTLFEPEKTFSDRYRLRKLKVKEA